MAEKLAQMLEDRLQMPQEEIQMMLRRTLVFVASIVFVLVATVFVAFDSIFIPLNSIAALKVDDIAPRNIVAPNNISYTSEVLTERLRQQERDAVAPVFDPPDANIARQQTQVAQQILDYVENVRADIYGTDAQRVRDLDAISALDLSEETRRAILDLDVEAWNAIKEEVLNVLSRMMRFEIRPGEEHSIRVQLNNQVASRFSVNERNIIVDIVDDLIQPNTFENVDATLAAREAEAAAVALESRTFNTGQIIVREGEPIDDLIYEALLNMNLLNTDESRLPGIVRAGVASILIMVMMGLYIARFNRSLLYNETRKLSLIAAIFLLTLGSVHFFGVDENFYLFPTAAMALLFVVIASPHVAIIASIGLALLVGITENDSLQYATIVIASGIIGTLSLRRAERLNQFFIAGALIAVSNVLVMIIFNVATPSNAEYDLLKALIYTAGNGVFITPMTAIAAMFIVTLVFNLPTTLRLIDLSQPSKPLLQRLLREAPGTYQHSLQVANLAEQAANAIDADAQLTHVAALYHDIGKMLNPLYFTENQQDIANPHDIISDPYRSADIIIGHITEGDELAKQYRLPQRIRDFIREHHGTTQVYVFYQRALNAVDGDESAVDIADFTYPGPRPRTKETAILMMADSCEAAVRSVKPQSKQEISDLVTKMIDGKRATGQLDDSGLTLNEIRTIRDIFVEILQGMFHPRINYQEAVEKKPKPALTPTKPKTAPPLPPGNAVAVLDKKPDTLPSRPKQESVPPITTFIEAKKVSAEMKKPAEIPLYDEDEAPMTDVPRLPTLDERRTTTTHLSVNGLVDKKDEEKDESEK
jgi:cyclic-di-AMP phosphodiesterase PgpH